MRGVLSSSPPSSTCHGPAACAVATTHAQSRITPMSARDIDKAAEYARSPGQLQCMPCCSAPMLPLLLRIWRQLPKPLRLVYLRLRYGHFAVGVAALIRDASNGR